MFFILLEPSSNPASLAECDRKKPGAIMTINHKRSGIPYWDRRACVYHKERVYL